MYSVKRFLLVDITQPGQAGIEDRRLKIEDLWYSVYIYFASII